MKYLVALACLMLLNLFCAPANSYDKARIIIMSDIGGTEPDDQESFVRLMLYSNEIDIVGLIGANSQFGINRGDTAVFNKIIDVFGQVRPNLLVHDPNYPTAEYLRSTVHEGQREFANMDAVGPGKETDGSDFIISELKKNDPRPLWFLAWGGINTLSQALYDLQEENLPQADFDKLIDKIRIYDVAGQDQSGAWIAHEFPGVFYLRSGLQFKAFSYRSDWYNNGDLSQQGDLSCVNQSWYGTNIMYHNGELGKMYPNARYMFEGDSPSIMYLVKNGLSDPEFPHFGSWGGRFQRVATSPPVRYNGHEDSDFMPAYVHNHATDKVIYNGDEYETVYTALWRWRQEFQNDFAARMDWSQTSDFASCNHAPTPVVNTWKTKDVIYIHANAGTDILLDASATTDPDGDSLSFNWWQYQEPGTYQGTEMFASSTDKVITFRVPADAALNDSIHLVLSVSDNGDPSLSAYRRVVIIAGEREPVKILSLGNSITQAKEGHNSYRRALWQKLEAGDYPVDFIGSMNTVYSNKPHPDNDFDTDHEGHWGWRADELAASLPTWLKSYTPDVVLLIIGSNDIRDKEPASEIIADIENIISALRAKNPSVTILLGSLLPTTDQTRIQGTDDVNALLPAFAGQTSTDESLVVFVNHTETVTTNMLYDSWHPNELGEETVAQNWFGYLEQYFAGTLNPKTSPPHDFHFADTTIMNVTLAWTDNLDNEEQFVISRSTNEGAYQIIAELPANTEEYTDTISWAHQYSYIIQSQNSYGLSVPANTITLNTTPPVKLASLHTINVKHNKITIGWDQQPDVKYTVIRTAKQTGFEDTLATIEAEQYTDTTVAESTEYYYIIFSMNTFGADYSRIDITTPAIPPVSEYTIQVNFNGDDQPLNGWNNVAGKDPGELAINMTNTEGDETEVDLSLITRTVGGNTYGHTTGNDSGIFPDVVLQSNYYTQSTDDIWLQLSGLDTVLQYTITLSGSRGGKTDNRNTVYRIADNEQVVNASQNWEGAAVFKNISAKDGIIDFAFHMEDGAAYGYLCGLRLEGTFPADTQTIALEPGWNFIAIDRIVANGELPGSLVTPETPVLKDEHAFYALDKPAHLNQLKTVQGGKAYAVYAKGNETIEIAGYAIGSQNPVELTSGWNLVPITSGMATETATYFSGNDQLKTIKSNNAFKTDTNTGTLDALQIGKAYYFYVE